MKRAQTTEKKIEDLSPAQRMVAKLEIANTRQAWESVQDAILAGDVKAIADIEIHPACALMPMMADDEWDAFYADVRENGFNTENALFFDERGRLVDGRHRLKALLLLRQDKTWGGSDLPEWKTLHGDDDAILARVISDNIHRRHLSTGQRAAIASEMATAEQGGQKGNNNASKNEGANLHFDNTTIDNAAKMMGVSERSVKQYRAAEKKVYDRYPDHADGIIEGVKSGAISVNKLEQIGRGTAKPEGVEQKKTSGGSKAKADPLATAIKQLAQAKKNIEKMAPVDAKELAPVLAELTETVQQLQAQA